MPDHLERIDYADTYSVGLPAPMDPAEFCSSILQAAPRWLDLLLSIRDNVAGPLGFNTQERNYGKGVHLAPGAKFGPLVVDSVTADRVVCADADRHLAFRAIFRTTDGPNPNGLFTTEVQFNDAVGRLYFAVVKPFHQRIIPALISAPFSSARARPMKD